MSLKSFVLSAVVFLASLSLQANITPESFTPESNTLRNEIANNLKNISMELIEDNTQLTIKIIIDEDRKIHVLGSSNKELKNEIMYRLNDKYTFATDAVENRIYTIPITLRKK